MRSLRRMHRVSQGRKCGSRLQRTGERSRPATRLRTPSLRSAAPSHGSWRRRSGRSRYPTRATSGRPRRPPPRSSSFPTPPATRSRRVVSAASSPAGSTARMSICACRQSRRCSTARVATPWSLPTASRDRSGSPRSSRCSGRRRYTGPPMPETVSTNQFKNGMHIELDGEPWRIVEFQHVKPGKGGAFVRTKLKALESGSVVDRTFRAGEKFSRVRTEVKNVQYLYDAGDDVVFMDEENYEQIHLGRGSVAEALEFLQPSGSVQLLMVDGKPAGVQLPASVELSVTETEPGIRGDTVSNVTKAATLETGAVVQVPLFVNVGDRLKIDPREKRYISRA